MKKTLTFILTSILIVFSLVFTACTPNSNNVYAGNYKEVTLAQFYEDLKSRQISSEIESDGIKFTLSVFNSDISDSLVVKQESVLDGVVVKSKEGGSFKAIINVTSNTSKINWSGETTTEEKISYYIDGDNYYKNYSLKKVTPDDESNESYTLKLNRDDFLIEFEDYENTVPTNPDEIELPETEEEIIAFLEDVCSTRGYKISTDASNGYKIKIDIGDMDAYKDYSLSQITSSSTPTFLLEVDAFEMYLVYDKNNNFLAQKQLVDMSTCYTSYTVRVKVDIDIRAYNGEVKLPTDLSSYPSSI